MNVLPQIRKRKTVMSGDEHRKYQLQKREERLKMREEAIRLEMREGRIRLEEEKLRFHAEVLNAKGISFDRDGLAGVVGTASQRSVGEPRDLDPSAEVFQPRIPTQHTRACQTGPPGGADVNYRGAERSKFVKPEGCTAPPPTKIDTTS